MESARSENQSTVTPSEILSEMPNTPASLPFIAKVEHSQKIILTDNDEDQEGTGSDNSDEENEKTAENGDIISSMNVQILKHVTEASKDKPETGREVGDENKHNDEDELKIKENMKRGRKLKKSSEKQTASHGRKVVFVTECTQTDWDWKEEAEKTGRGTILLSSADNVSTTSSRSATLKSFLVKSDSRQSLELTLSNAESRQETKTVTDFTPFCLVPDDEFGVPVVEMSSDSDSSDGELHQRPKHYKHHLPSVGPPLILRYIRESDSLEKQTDKTTGSHDDETSQWMFENPDREELGYQAGMFGGLCEFCGMDIKPFPSVDQQLSQSPESLYCCEEYREFVEFATTEAARLEEDVAKKSQKISVKVHAHHGSKQERQMAKEKAIQRMHEREIQRRQQEAKGIHMAYNQFARQMKTINYQLSSQRCLEEGWTLRAPSPLENDDLETEVYVPEPVNLGPSETGKERPMVEKFYPDGSKFLTLFPDGTGNVFYPSGRISILIISSKLGQNTYITHDDSEDQALLAMFDPHGCGCCYFSNGKVRLVYDPVGGLELDYSGGRKRSWSWLEHEPHVHAPPFQPIVFAMNSYLSIRIMDQDNIALTLAGRKRSCRFNVGSKLKIVSPESNYPKVTGEHQLVISEHKVKVQTILNKISNLLKFPKSPKVEHILPPLSVSARKQKVEKMKQATAELLKQQKTVKQIRLPPLDSKTVSVK